MTPKPIKATLCRQCVTGWDPTLPKTFDPRCRGCQQKLADGRRTGNEPPPPKFPAGSKRSRNLSPERFAALVGRMKRAKQLRVGSNPNYKVA